MKEAAPKQEKQGKAAAKAEESPSDSELRSAVEAIVAGQFLQVTARRNPCACKG